MKKILVNLVNRLEQLAGKDTKPNFCCFGMTDDCILRCRMCYKWKKDISVQCADGRPTIAQWKDAITSLRMITDEGFLINFGGGEPLLMEGLLELVRFAADLGVRTNIATNAYLIDEDMAKAIADSRLSTLNISLDSIRDSTHDYLRGVNGVYDRAMEAIGYLHRYCPKLKKGTCTVIYDMNLDDIIDLTEFVEQDGRLEWVYFMAAMQPNNTCPDSEWYKKEFRYLWPQDAKKVNSTINRLIELKKKGYKIVNQISQLKAFKSYFINPQRFVKAAPCNLSRAIHISSVGDVFICFQHEKLGNIKSDRLEDLWHSDNANIVRQDIAGCQKNCHFLINCFFEGDFPFSF